MRNELQLGSHQLKWNEKTYIMGILNVTPDSFSDGGQYNRLPQAIDHAAQMVKDGADIIDIGGESTRPGAEKISLEEELERAIPVVEAISSRLDVPLSIDTYKAEVARQAIQAGAHMINDVWGAKADAKMAHVAKEKNVPIILMHNREHMDYTSLLSDIIIELKESISIAHQAGIKDEHIILDPGIGFAKTYEHNLIVMRQLEEIVALGYPLLLGTSRKSLIKHTLHLPADQRVEGTIATICLGMTKGCRMVRVHDVQEVRRAVRMMDSMLGIGVPVEHG